MQFNNINQKINRLETAAAYHLLNNFISERWSDYIHIGHTYFKRSDLKRINKGRKTQLSTEIQVQKSLPRAESNLKASFKYFKVSDRLFWVKFEKLPLQRIVLKDRE